MASSSGFSFLRDMSDRVRATAADASSVLQPKVRAASRSLSTSLAEATANLRLGDLPGTGGGSSALYAGEPELAATMATLDATREGLRATGAAVAKHRAALLAVADARPVGAKHLGRHLRDGRANGGGVIVPGGARVVAAPVDDRPVYGARGACRRQRRGSGRRHPRRRFMRCGGEGDNADAEAGGSR